MNSKKSIAFRRALVRWFAHDRRDLPWRCTRDPYSILVSEIMLQQTQVAAVSPYYNRWLRRFPNVAALGRARESSVLRAWQGLGYYARARNLHRCAKSITERFGGKFPRNRDQLESLPGIGRYTANAIAVFAFDQSLPIVEANTGRVLARLFDIREAIDSTPGRLKLWDASARLVPKTGARDFHNAMMDLGALVCTARNPHCAICPVKKFCATRDPNSLPRKRKPPATISLSESHSFRRSADVILLEHCRNRWRGMWMLPKARARKSAPIHRLQFPFTHHRITLQIFRSRSGRLTSDHRWFPIRQLNNVPIPSPHRRALDALLT